ncbi:18621_t:CDS:2, partial [Racocetra fulgida]
GEMILILPLSASEIYPVRTKPLAVEPKYMFRAELKSAFKYVCI